MPAALLKDVLPVADTTNPETIRCHLHKVADRHDTELGTSEPGLRDDGPAAGQASPIAREAVIVGIDGGYLRNWHDKRKKFEAIVGKSMAEDRDDRCFGLVRSQDAATERRFCEGEHKIPWGAQAAAAGIWVSFAAGYHFLNVSCRVSSRVLVRVCRSRWAPAFDHCICCFLAKRLPTT